MLDACHSLINGNSSMGYGTCDDILDKFVTNVKSGFNTRDLSYTVFSAKETLHLSPWLTGCRRHGCRCLVST